LDFEDENDDDEEMENFRLAQFLFRRNQSLGNGFALDFLGVKAVAIVADLDDDVSAMVIGF
jgi:hypothetical protein